MIQIMGSRGTGKTSQLLRMAERKNGVIVCANPHAMFQKSKDYGLVIPEDHFYSYYDFKNGYLDVANHAPIFIDEIGCYLRSINPDVVGYSESLGD